MSALSSTLRPFHTVLARLSGAVAGLLPQSLRTKRPRAQGDHALELAIVKICARASGARVLFLRPTFTDDYTTAHSPTGWFSDACCTGHGSFNVATPSGEILVEVDLFPADHQPRPSHGATKLRFCHGDRPTPREIQLALLGLVCLPARMRIHLLCEVAARPLLAARNPASPSKRGSRR